VRAGLHHDAREGGENGRAPSRYSAPEAVKRPGRPRDLNLPERRREEILAAATEVFAQRGYRSTDLQIVADSLGLAKGTLYRYFRSKRQLFLAAADRGMRRLKEHCDAARSAASDPLEQVALAVRAYLAFFDQNPALVELLIQERAEFKDRKKPTYFEHRDANIERWRRLFRGLIREGRVRRIPAGRITDVISDLLYGAMFANFFAGRRKSFERQAEDILDVVFRGILARGGT
jgi:AcrR family transcriptional regulator